MKPTMSRKKPVKNVVLSTNGKTVNGDNSGKTYKRERRIRSGPGGAASALSAAGFAAKKEFPLSPGKTGDEEKKGR